MSGRPADRNRETILREIRRVAGENGGQPPGSQMFFNETGIRRGDWVGRYWARWSDALKEAGLEPNTLTPAYTDELLTKTLVDLTRKLGHLPTRAEVDLERRSNPTLPHFTAISRALGTTQARRAERVLEYCGRHPGFDDVAEISRRRLAAAPTATSSPRAQPRIPDGAVYLFKSGRYFKIGRSNATGRRERELVLLMPEKGSVVHSIATDDPPGIEAYWHRRFESKRKGGEWFDLDAVDVSAFKRRRFM